MNLHKTLLHTLQVKSLGSELNLNVFGKGFLGCLHTCTFWCAPRFNWCQSSVCLDDVNAVVQTRVRAHEPYQSLHKKCSVHVNSSTVHYWYDCNRTISWKWTTIDDTCFDKTVCVCSSHSLSYKAGLTHYKQRECLSHFCL